MANVAFVRPELSKLLDQYYLIRDVLSGEVTVKGQGEKYLPMPNSTDKSTENKERYDAYKKRAVFYNVARRTLYGLTGQVFQRDPVIEVPDLMDSILDNATGSGLDITQLAKRATQLTLAYSRCGLFVDYPVTDGGATVADLQAGRVRPTLYVYSPQEIVNWRTVDRGAEEVLSLVVLRESFTAEDDGFEIKQANQFRVLRLDENGHYIHEVWRENAPTEYYENRLAKGQFQPSEVYRPTDAHGNPLTEIPFTFIGADNNDSNPDNPLFYDLCSLNVAHYRNSADYEESCFLVGQPTPVLTGLTEEWVEDVLKGVVAFGSRGGIPLPVGASAQLLQASPNTMIKEAMETKERQMVALGAKLVEQRATQRTATEAGIEAAAESSTLASVTRNVASAFQWGLQWAARLMNLPDKDITFELNTDFDLARMAPEERSQLLQEWQMGAISFNEMRAALRKTGVATLDNDEAKEEIQADSMTQMGL